MMISKMIFVLVILATDGTAQRFATFESMEQCQVFAKSYNATNSGFGRAACIPEDQQSAADVQRDFDQAMAMMEQFMGKMHSIIEKQKRKEL